MGKETLSGVLKKQSLTKFLGSAFLSISIASSLGACNPPKSLESNCKVEDFTFKDTDCDGVWNEFDKYEGYDDFMFDADKDKIPDFMDLYNGNDMADDDKDGYANWIDLAPQNPSITINYQTNQNPASIGDTTSGNTRIDYGKEVYTKDSDGDGVPDYLDPQPNLKPYQDTDYDGYNDGVDLYPLDATKH